MTPRTARLSPMLVKLLADPEARTVFEREQAINAFLLGLEGAMKDQDLSRSELAKRVGKSPQSVSRALKGKQNLTVGTMMELLVSVGKTLDLQVVDLPPLQATMESRHTLSRKVGTWQSRAEGSMAGEHVRYTTTSVEVPALSADTCLA